MMKPRRTVQKFLKVKLVIYTTKFLDSTFEISRIFQNHTCCFYIKEHKFLFPMVSSLVCKTGTLERATAFFEV